MKTPITKRPPRKAKRWFPYPEGNWLNKIVGVTILALTSPLWIPIWILHLPFRFYRERQEKKERLASQLLRESTPPPPRDLELERRRIQAREEQKISSHRLRRYRDPIEKDPEIAKLVRAAAERAHQEVSGGRYEHLGTCHLIWRRQEEILKEEHGIVWYPPSRMNPHIIYD
jgi:hypothetical protein